MTDNKSFILRGINDVVYEERPVPEGAVLRLTFFYSLAVRATDCF